MIKNGYEHYPAHYYGVQVQMNSWTRNPAIRPLPQETLNLQTKTLVWNTASFLRFIKLTVRETVVRLKLDNMKVEEKHSLNPFCHQNQLNTGRIHEDLSSCKGRSTSTAIPIPGGSFQN